MRQAFFAVVLLGLWAGLAAQAGDLEQFKSSTWDTRYKGDGIDGPIRAYVYFSGQKGKYRALDADGDVILRGTFSDVTYKEKGDKYIISGNWEAAKVTGTFRFEIDQDDLNSFSGTWETDKGKEGTWKGTRKPVPFKP